MFIKRSSLIVFLITMAFILANCDRARFGEISGTGLSSTGDNSSLGDVDDLDVIDLDIVCDPLSGKRVIYQWGGKKHRDRDKDDENDNDDDNDDDNDNDNDNDDDQVAEDDNTSQETTVCEIPDDIDDPETGLIGEIFYLLPEEHSDMFGGSLRNTVLNDYYTYGYRVETLIYMTEINVSPRSWEAGFRLPDGSIVKDLNGNDLFEWFAIRLDGHLRLPEGEYDFAIMSDDGMTVDLNGERIVGLDGIHAPTLTCGESSVVYGADESKDIHLEYFQGPRVEISMQLLYRPHDPNGRCRNDGSWQTIGAENYSK